MFLVRYVYDNFISRCDGIGRRARLKILCGQPRAGSTPAIGNLTPFIREFFISNTYQAILFSIYYQVQLLLYIS